MPEIIERTAKLFEAGSYPDKGIDITTDALDSIVGSFTSIPVKVEHSDTPFDGALGNCTKIWRDGSDLKGTIGFSPEAWQLIDKAGAKKLSIGVKRDLSGLTEVSLVKNPRVASPTVFDDRIEVFGELDDTQTVVSDVKSDDIQNSQPLGGIKMAEPTNVTPEGVVTLTDEMKAYFAQQLKEHGDSVRAEFSSENTQLKAEVARLTGENKVKDVQFKLDEMKRAGKLTPALEPMARIILLSGSQEVTFNDEKIDVATVFTKFIESMPELVNFNEQGKTDGTVVTLSNEQREINKKLGISDEDFIKYSGGK